MKRLLVASLALVAALPLAAGQTAAAQAINSGARYATDAYPGFDEVKESTHPEKKTPKWFSWLTGPKMEDSAAQFSYCRGLIAEESYSKAVRELDALVREWPVSGEAPEAQRLLAETLETKLRDCEEAFREWRYLVDFYSVQCDYSAAVDALYRVASVQRISSSRREAISSIACGAHSAPGARRTHASSARRTSAVFLKRKNMIVLPSMRMTEATR